MNALLGPSSRLLAGTALLADAGAFYFLRLEWGPGPALCAAAAAILIGQLGEDDARASAAAALFSLAGLALITLLGLRLTAAIGMGLCLWGLPALKNAAVKKSEPSELIGWLLISAAAAAWTRVLSLFIGHPVYALALWITAFGTGVSAAAWLRQRLGVTTRVWSWSPLAAGLWGLFSLTFLRFIGLNASSAERLQTVFLSSADAVGHLAQYFILAALWSAGACARAKSPGGSLPRLAACALLGPAAGYGMLKLGAAPALAAANAALMTLGLWQALRAAGRLSGFPVKAAVAVAAGLWLSSSSAELFRTVWTNRLDAAYPGGRFLLFQDDGREILSVYRFSTKSMALLSDGFASSYTESGGKHATHIPLLLHPGARRVLALGARHPETLRSTLTHEVTLDAVDPHSSYRGMLDLISDKPLAGKVSFIQETSRAFLNRPGEGYDVILQELTYPLERPGNLLKLTSESLSRLRRRLNAGGLAAIRLPVATNPGRLNWALTAVAGSFAKVGLCRFSDGDLILASDADFTSELSLLSSKISDDVWIDDPRLGPDLAASGCAIQARPLSPAAAPPSEDRLPRGLTF